MRLYLPTLQSVLVMVRFGRVRILCWWPGENNSQDVYGNSRGTVSGGVTFAPSEVALGFPFDGSTGYCERA